MDKHASIYVAGHQGMVGSAIVRALTNGGFDNLIVRTSKELDLRDNGRVATFFAEVKPDYVFLAAAKVGGILANSTFPAEFIYDNLAIQTNVIHQAYVHGVKKLLFLGSSCIYPKHAPQPMKEEHLLTGPLEPTNEWYAVAKIAGIKMCQAYRRQYECDFIAAMPTNLYGLGDNYHPKNSHVIPALIRKAHEAKERGDREMMVWGSGSPRREFLYSDDLADACVFLMEKASEGETGDLINVGVGTDLTIAELAHAVAEAVGFEGALVFDRSKPDGTPRKLLDVSRLHGLGWKARTDLNHGLKLTYRDFLSHSRIGEPSGDFSVE